MPKDVNFNKRKATASDVTAKKAQKVDQEIVDDSGFDTTRSTWRESRIETSTPTTGVENTTQADRQGSVGGVDSGGTGEISTRPFHHRNNSWKWCFKKSHDFFSHSWAKRVLHKGTSPNIRSYMSTSMAFIPVEFPWLYAMPSEWAQLPEESYVTHASISLFYDFGRTSFETNASDAITATANNQLWLNMDIDCLKHPGIAVQNYGDASQPVLTTDIQSVTADDYKLFTEKLYGTADITTADANPPAIAGTWTEWPFFYAYALSSYNTTNGASSTTCGWPYVKGWYQRMIAKNNENTHMYSYDIHFGNNLVTNQRLHNKWAPPGVPGSHRMFFNKDSYMHNGLIQVGNTGLTAQISPSTPQTATRVNPNKDYFGSMWNPNKFGLKPGHVTNSALPPPCIAFGLEEIPAMTASNDKMTYQEGQGFWRLDVELHGYSKWEVCRSHEVSKPYTHTLYAYDPAPMLVPEDHGQGKIFGRYWQ